LFIWQNLIVHTGIALLSLISSVQPQAQAPQPWEPLGPLGQTISDFQADANDPNKIYAVGGSYFLTSSDFGVSWDYYQVGDGTEWLDSLLNDPTDPKVFYSTSPYETYKSINSGLSWYSIGSGFRQIAADPFTPGKLYAADGGLYLSTDFGETWALSPYPTPYTISTVTVDPTTPSVIYISGSTGIDKSIDGGESWTSIYGNLTNQRFTKLLVSPQDSNVIYAVPGDYGVYLTRSGGVEWTRVTEEWVLITTFAMDPNDSATIYYGESYNGVYQSEDWGQTWNKITQNLPAIYPKSIFPLGDPEKTVFIGLSSDGVFHKNGNETLWTPCGLSNSVIGAFAADPTNGERMYLARNKSGLYKTSDGGKHWSLINNGLPEFAVTGLAIDPHNPDLIYLGLDNEGLYRSTNQGASWSKVNIGPYSDRQISSLIIDPRSSERIFGIQGNQSVLRSLDGGSTWTMVGEIMYGKYSLKLDPFDPDTLYLTNRGLQKSVDNGDSWEIISNGIPTTNLYGVFPSPAQPGVLFVTTEYGELYKTVDGGQNWSALLLFNNRIHDLAFDPRIPSIIYASGRINEVAGMFYSTNGGSNWSFYGNPIDSTSELERLYINTRQNELIASKHYDSFGVYKTDLLPIIDSFLPIIFGWSK
jgi:photosystem II stability/assembly factor-like uncharacterized protein